MKLKLIAGVDEGIAFHYYGNPERVFVKSNRVHAIAPDGRRVRVSPSTLVVPHEGSKNGGRYDETAVTRTEAVA